MNATTRKSIYVVSLLTASFAAIPVAMGWLAPAGESSVLSRPAAAAFASIAPPVPMIGVATGESEGGLPVYRLPSITVSAKRSVELAKMAQEDRVAQASANIR